MSTSTFAKAKTSAEADIDDKNPVTVDLASDAVTTPIEPMRKYESARFPESEDAR